MKKVIYDKDLGLDCGYVASGNTEEEAIHNATAHLKDKHPDEYHNMHLKDKLAENVKDEQPASA
jgi:predicted small metal-binding protein